MPKDKSTAAAPLEKMQLGYCYSSLLYQGSLAEVQLFTPALVHVVVLVLIHHGVKLIFHLICGFGICITGFFMVVRFSPEL